MLPSTPHTRFQSRSDSTLKACCQKRRQSVRESESSALRSPRTPETVELAPVARAPVVAGG